MQNNKKVIAVIKNHVGVQEKLRGAINAYLFEKKLKPFTLHAKSLMLIQHELAFITPDVDSVDKL